MTNDWTILCQCLVPETLRQRDWQLVTEDELPAFIEEVRQTIADGIVRPKPGDSHEATVRRATVHRYCHQLYQACGEQGSLRQRRALEEIGRYAQGVAFRFEHDPAIVCECAQWVLTKVWQKLDQIREPGSLLRWVETTVYREITGYWRKKQQQPEEVLMSQLIMDEGPDDREILQRFWETLSAMPPTDDEVINREQRDQLWSQVRRVLADRPRHEAVVVGYYLYELSLPALAEMLRTSVSNIYVIKTRALARLRADEAFVQQFADALETL